MRADAAEVAEGDAPLFTIGRGCRLPHPLWKLVWQHLNQETKSTNDPAITFEPPKDSIYILLQTYLFIPTY